MNGIRVRDARLDSVPSPQVAIRPSATAAPEYLDVLAVQRLLGNSVVSGLLAPEQPETPRLAPAPSPGAELPADTALDPLLRAVAARLAPTDARGFDLHRPAGESSVAAAARRIVEGARVGAPEGWRELDARQAAAGVGRVSGGQAGLHPAPQAASTRAGGILLPPTERARLEPRLGIDLARVRIHTDAAAQLAAARLGARAFTRGADIYFGAGRYRPGTQAGSALIAHEVAHVAQEAPTGVLQRQPDNDEPAWYEEAGEWALGAVGGEWVDEQTFGQIGADFVLSVIPGVDQVADARDLAAHVYRLGFRGEHTQWTRWLGLVFTLIGLIPELGSIIKSASKAVMKGARELLSHADDLIRLARRLLPDIGDLRRVEELITSNWNRAVQIGRQAWESLLARGSDLAARIPKLLAAMRGRVVGAFERLRELSGRYLGAAFDRVRAMIGDIFAQVREKLGPGAPTPKPNPISGAQQVPLSQADYERALGHSFPSHALQPLLSTVDRIGEAAARGAVNNPAFVQACQSGNWKLAGTLFHSAAAREARTLPAGALPAGWIIDAERTIQSGPGGSRLDILARGPNGQMIEIDWKTTGRSGISKASRDEMVKHAGQVTANLGGQLASQTSRSWVDLVRPLLPGIDWPR